MTPRLRVLNAVILLCVAVVCQAIWKRSHDANIARNMLRAPLVKADFSLPKPLLAFSPLHSASYVGIAEGNLFSPDRNPNITFEGPPVHILPLPPLPLLSGVLFLDGLSPTLLLSVRSGIEKRAYHKGDTVGNWQIDSFDRRQIVLEWRGSQVTKLITDLVDYSTVKAQTVSAQENPSAPNVSAPQNAAPLPPGQLTEKTISEPGKIP